MGDKDSSNKILRVIPKKDQLTSYHIDKAIEATRKYSQSFATSLYFMGIPVHTHFTLPAGIEGTVIFNKAVTIKDIQKVILESYPKVKYIVVQPETLNLLKREASKTYD